MNIEIANRLIALRKDSGLSQEELAARLGVSRQAVSKWERGESAPDTDNLIGISRLFAVSLDELLLTGITAAQTQSAAYSEKEQEEKTEGNAYENYAASASFAYSEEWEKEQRRLKRQRFLRFPYPVFVALCYLVMGFQFGLWHPGWMVFLTIPLYYGMAAAI